MILEYNHYPRIILQLQLEGQSAHRKVGLMCGVSLKDERLTAQGFVVFYDLLVIQSVADVMRCGRMRWLRHLECKIGCFALVSISAYSRPRN